MQLNQIKEKFTNELQKLYSEGELRTMFFWLAEEYLQKTKIELLSNPDFSLDQKALLLFTKAIQRLKLSEPIQHILGYTEFCEMKFNVNSSVLIPRPETEELVEWIAKDYQGQSPKIIDIGTGSGCIGISLAQKIKAANVTLLDVSKDALLIAKQNAKNNSAKVSIAHKNILEIEQLENDYDVIVSNPPYVLDHERHLMRENVLNHEPHLALFVKDNNPLLFYHKIANLAKAQNKNCDLFFEINEKYGKQLLEDFEQLGFENIELKNDFLNKPRMLKASWKTNN